VPFTGFAAVDSGVAMRKDYTKLVVADAGVPVLPHVLISRRDLGEPEVLLREIGNRLPAIIKPASLGSSIGVGVAQTAAEVLDVARFVLLKDSYALIEPRVPNLVEYNIAVRSAGGTIKVSAIERPKPSTELLDFKEKYLSGGGGAKGTNLPSQGMLSLTREINPALPGGLADKLRRWAIAAFEAVDGTGAPRVDFYCNEATGETWLNEVNPIPGSFAFFLWEAADPPLGFTALLSALIDEAVARHRESQLPDDPVPPEARLLRRP
jgi:D-alanine-D-alanine ligase